MKRRLKSPLPATLLFAAGGVLLAVMGAWRGAGCVCVEATVVQARPKASANKAKEARRDMREVLRMARARNAHDARDASARSSSKTERS
jgi:2-keto-3-deoxy-6-phosphogluconate aldolase